MKAANVYLLFDGNCRAAMEFYKKCLGGELFVMPFSEAQCTSPPGTPIPDRLAHAALKKDAALLMASDIWPGMPLQQGNSYSVCLECESLDEQSQIFTALGEGGKVTMPLQKTFWGANFGTLTDQFGVNWMFNFALPAQG